MISLSLIKCKGNANGLNLNYFLTFLSRENTIIYKFESINPDLVSVKFDAFITITNEREHDGQNLLAINLETFCVSVECLEFELNLLVVLMAFRSGFVEICSDVLTAIQRCAS